ncbi:hypothetical protein LXL04_037785 [Taraxacum kok-saghyz]
MDGCNEESSAIGINETEIVDLTDSSYVKKNQKVSDRQKKIGKGKGYAIDSRERFKWTDYERFNVGLSYNQRKSMAERRSAIGRRKSSKGRVTQLTVVNDSNGQTMNDSMLVSATIKGNQWLKNSYIPENPRTPPISYISQTVITFKKPTSGLSKTFFLTKPFKYVL